MKNGTEVPFFNAGARRSFLKAGLFCVLAYVLIASLQFTQSSF
jgi:hypothetical protein